MPGSLRGRTVWVTGGSAGLGKQIAKAVAAQGAHVTIFARRQPVLDAAQQEILDARLDSTQLVNAISVDLSDASKVDSIFRSQPTPADVLYCAAGGCPTQCGFLADITSADLESCMQMNYFTAAYTAQSLFKLWTQDEKTADIPKTTTPARRQIVFINSAGAFVGLPGYTAYTPAKTAVRALADTMRMEALRYSSPAVNYRIQCAFPSNFISDSFIEEQKCKPQLTKDIEETAADISELEKKLPTAKKVADYIVANIDSRDFALCDSTESALLWANMIGPSPKRGLGILDTLMAFLVSLIMWPLLRRQWDAKCKKDHHKLKR